MRVVMPFYLRTFLKMFRLAFRDRMSPRRRTVVVTLLFAIPALATINAVGWLLDWVLFPGILFVRVEQPVFIIGHARSGTTLMHRLFTSDPGRFSWFMTYEMLFPSLTLRRLIRFLARLDEKLLAGRLDRRRRAWEDRVFAKGREMHPMSLTGPEEDDFILAPSCASGFWIMLFPYMKELERELYYVDEQSPRARRTLMRFYRRCVQRQLHLNGRERTHCSKNPTYSGRVESLIETFPGARFVVLYRHPYETIPSLLKLMQRNWRGSDCDRARMEDSLARLARQSFQTYTYPLQVLARHPETTSTVVDYRELVAHPKATVAAAYRALGLSMTPAFEHVLEEEERRSAKHRAEHVYTLEEFGLARSEIRAQLGDLFERFQWGEDVGEDDARSSVGAATVAIT